MRCMGQGTPEVNLRTAKIDLLQMMHERTGADRFDVASEFDFVEPTLWLDGLHSTALRAVDFADATLESIIHLIQAYRHKYLKAADDIRSTIRYSYQHGAVSLLSFLDAQNQYRTTRFSAANRLNFAVGLEVIQ